MCATAAHCQDSDTKRINLIKLDPAYYYGESTNADQAVALEAAQIELVNHANNALREQGKPAKMGLEDIASAECIMVPTRRGVRAFVYMKRDGSKPSVQPIAAAAPAPAPTPAPASTPAPTPAPAPAPAPVAKAEPSLPVVNGRVLDENGQEIAGATVVVSGTRNATSTDLKGDFKIQCAPDAVLKVSYVGYDPATFAVAGKSVVMVNLTPAVKLPERSFTGVSSGAKLAPWQADLIEEILEQPDFDTTMRLLDIFKGSRKITGFGAPSTCPSERNACWVIFGEEDTPYTVLVPDRQGGFTDAGSGTPDDLAKYARTTAVWFMLNR